ncbi:unnamed protein product, partial [marine sediment metagenome]
MSEFLFPFIFRIPFSAARYVQYVIYPNLIRRKEWGVKYYDNEESKIEELSIY